MVKRWKVFWFSVWAILFGGIFARNYIKYKDHSIWWLFFKSLTDLSVLGLFSIFATPLLIAADVLWIQSFFSKKWQKFTFGTIAAIVLGLLSELYMEVLVVIGIFSVDLKTGPENGILKRWHESKDKPLNQVIAA